MSRLRLFFRGRTLNAVCMALIIAIAGHAGFGVLKDWHGPQYTLTNELYVPSAMFALGRGFIDPPLEELPGLRDFLYLTPGHNTYAPSSLPENFSKTELDDYQRYHRYLVYAMGIIWRIFGISFESAKILAVSLHVASVLLVFAILRLGMNRLLSLAGALMFGLSPVVLSIVFNIRDFSKAPFLIATIGLLLYLIREPRSPARYLRCAAVLGLVVGLGTGFRRDLIVCIPPALLILAVAPMYAPGLRLRRRFTGMLCFALLLLVSAAPVLGAFRDRGSLAWHDMMMGMSTSLEDNLGMTHAQYERVPVKHDAFISGIAACLARRTYIGGSKEAEERYGMRFDSEKRLFVLKTFTTFPADMIARADAAVLRVLHGVEEYRPWMLETWSLHMERWGSLYAVVCLAVVALTDLRLAVLLLLLTLYFGGITSLQYESRHAFHLLFLPVGFFLLPWQFLLNSLRKLLSASGRAALAERRNALLDGEWRLTAKRLRSFAVAALLLTVGPWLLAMPFQFLTVRGIDSKLREAKLRQLPTKSITYGDWTYFKAMEEPPAVVPDPHLEQNFFRPLYLVAEFTAYPDGSPLEILVQNQDGWHGFGQLVQACPPGQAQGHIRYFFTVPTEYSEQGWVRFEAVGIPNAYADRFVGLSVVLDPDPIGTNSNYALADTPPLPGCFQGIQSPFRGFPKHWQPAAGMPTLRHDLDKVQDLLRAQKAAEALPKLDAALSWGLLRMEIFYAKAEAYRQLGDETGRTQTLLAGLAEFRNDPALARAWEYWIREQGPNADVLGLWQRAAAVAPDNIIVKSRVETELQKKRAGLSAGS